MKKPTDIEKVLKQLKARKQLLVQLIGRDDGSELGRDRAAYQEGKLQAITEVIALIEGLKAEG